MKTQIKKSISLFLAVLMVLSCWVFVAPEKASADYTSGQYYIKITGTISAYCKNVTKHTMVISYDDKNGTESNGNSYTYTTTNIGTMFNTNGTVVTLFEGYIDGFPTSIRHDVTISQDLFKTRKLQFNAGALYVGKDKDHLTSVWTHSGYGFGNSAGYSCTYGYSKNENITPYIDTADALSDASLTCPAVGTALTTVKSTTAVIPTYWDQYGVKWIATADPTYHISATDNGDDIGSGEAVGFWTVKDDNTKKGYVKINSAMQENFTPSASGENTYYMVSTVKNSKGTDVEVSQKITVSFNEITFTFDGDGSVSGLNSTINDAKGNELGTDTYAPTGYYGNSVTLPTNTSVTAGEGYTFLGFWTEKQPSSGAAYYYSKESEFAYPCSTADYASYKAMAGAEESNGVVTVTVDGVEKRFDIA